MLDGKEGLSERFRLESEKSFGRVTVLGGRPFETMVNSER